jgi:hypothetical protein
VGQGDNATLDPQPRAVGAQGRGLAHGKRIAAKVIAVQLDQVEGIEEDAVAMAPVAHSLEAGDAVCAADDRLAVDAATWPLNAIAARLAQRLSCLACSGAESHQPPGRAAVARVGEC